MQKLKLLHVGLIIPAILLANVTFVPMETAFEGIWLIDKPLGMTSFGVIRKMRKILGLKKIGHAGTLDPLATGLLIVCSGAYTKQIESLMGMPKTYTGSFYLGATTESYDLEHPPIVTNSNEINVSGTLMHETAKHFVGELWQTPPAHSAIKINGKRAYKTARKGDAPEVKPRLLKIDNFEIVSEELPEIAFKVSCSKGTYIRSLAFDYGEKIGTGAYLASLRRTHIGPFDVKDALNLQELENVIHF